MYLSVIWLLINLIQLRDIILVSYQAKLFEKSTDLNCSSPAFLRRFLCSDLVNILDENDSTILYFRC